jgi:hypothetical protein
VSFAPWCVNSLGSESPLGTDGGLFLCRHFDQALRGMSPTAAFKAKTYDR